MKVAIAGDHYTVDLLKKVEMYLAAKGIGFINVGTMDSEKKISLQEIIPAVATKIQSHEADLGIMACGTGAGVEIGANKLNDIRASLCVLPKQAENARIYDNANVLCLSSWLTEDPAEILNAWFEHTFDGNEGRKKMLEDFDAWRKS